MKARLLLYYILLFASGNCFCQNINNETKEDLASTATKIGLDQSDRTKYRIWYDYYVIELVCDNGRYTASINYYLHWISNNKINRKKGFEFNRKELTEKQASDLYMILTDSLKMKERMDKEDLITLFPSCMGYIEYFGNDGSYINKECDYWATLNADKKNCSFYNYLQPLLEADNELLSLLGRVRYNKSFHFFSKTNCCCVPEYDPETGKIKWLDIID